MSSMTPDRITEIKSRCEAATEGPWEYWDNRGKPYWLHRWPQDAGFPPTGLIVGEMNQGVQIGKSCSLHKPADCLFVANARQDVPDLVEALEAAQQWIAELEGVCGPASVMRRQGR